MANVLTLASVGKPESNENAEWIKVAIKKAKKKAIVEIRLEAIFISSKGNLLYAEFSERT